MSDDGSKLAKLQIRAVLLELIDGLNAHQQVLGHILLDERPKAIAQLAVAGDAIAAAVERIAIMIETD